MRPLLQGSKISGWTTVKARYILFRKTTERDELNGTIRIKKLLTVAGGLAIFPACYTASPVFPALLTRFSAWKKHNKSHNWRSRSDPR